jgi:tyrosyl-tRNA synthetase
MWRYYLLLTDRSAADVDALRADVASGAIHPKQAKSDLASAIVADFHSPADARRAAEAFEARFSRGELVADELPEVRVAAGPDAVPLSKIVADAGLASSRSEATRKVQQGGVRVNRERVTDIKATVRPGDGPLILEVGRRAVRVVFE